MKKKETAKIFAEIILRNIKTKTSYSMIIQETKNYGIYNSEVVQNYIKRLIYNKKDAYQITYDTMLECEGFYDPCYIKDVRYIKHKDRKQGWWD